MPAWLTASLSGLGSAVGSLTSAAVSLTQFAGTTLMSVGRMLVSVISMVTTGLQSLLSVGIGTLSSIIKGVVIGLGGLAVGIGTLLRNLSDYSQRVTTLSNQTGLSVGQSNAAIQTASALGVPQTGISTENAWAQGMASRALYGGSGSGDESDIRAMIAKFRPMLEAGGAQMMAAQAMLRAAGKENYANVIMQPEAITNRQFERSNQLQGAFGLNPKEIENASYSWQGLMSTIGQGTTLVLNRIAADLMPTFNTLLDNAVSYVSANSGKISEWITTATSWIINGVERVYGFLTAQDWPAIGAAVQGGFNLLVDGIRGAVPYVVEFARFLYAEVPPAFASVGSTILGFVGMIAEAAPSIFQMIVGGLESVRAKAVEIWNMVKPVVNAVTDDPTKAAAAVAGVAVMPWMAKVALGAAGAGGAGALGALAVPGALVAGGAAVIGGGLWYRNKRDNEANEAHRGDVAATLAANDAMGSEARRRKLWGLGPSTAPKVVAAENPILNAFGMQTPSYQQGANPVLDWVKKAQGGLSSYSDSLGTPGERGARFDSVLQNMTKAFEPKPIAQDREQVALLRDIRGDMRRTAEAVNRPCPPVNDQMILSSIASMIAGQFAWEAQS